MGQTSPDGARPAASPAGAQTPPAAPGRRATADPAHPLLAVNLWIEPGRTFRAPARWFPDASANLGLAKHVLRGARRGG
ncbi:DUF6924 domain-containing protein [Streptomyces sp. NBC_01264]|uniref:DUF6924 domain-containing protein n=1 Tax=Streptomyces sp. NBC_01264 TaxID=2903804 RepID=UPI003D3006E7